MWKQIVLDVECIVCNKSLQNIDHRLCEKARKMGKIIKDPSARRRSRTPNWSPHERQYLLELIKDRKDVIMSKNTNGPYYSEEKDFAWNEILRMLIAKYGDKFIGRSIKKLKTQWQNMRRIARDEIVLYGQSLDKFSRQSLEVCTLMELVKDGELVATSKDLDVVPSEERNPLAATETSTGSMIEIKTECMDDDYNQPSTSAVYPIQPQNNQSKAPSELIMVTPQTIINADLSTSGSEDMSDPCEMESSEVPIEPNIRQDVTPIKASKPADTPRVCPIETRKSSVSIMTEPSIQETPSAILKPLQHELQDFFKYTAVQKQLKMDMMKEERQVIKAMRETAELNKIIAEQKLKHVLWIKKHEMAMYSGEPGSGAGKGGGGGGAIRDAGGAFGKMEAAREDEYFYKQQREQLTKLKAHVSKEINFHQEQIKRHEDAIRRHKESMGTVDTK